MRVDHLANHSERPSRRLTHRLLTHTVRRLREQQSVELDLESQDHIISCRVASITGLVATLDRVGAPAPPPEGALGYMVFEHRGAMVALRGVTASVDSDGPGVEFVVIDGVQLPERRAGERIPLAARVQISRLAEDTAEAEPVETVTANISASGALIERRPGLGERPEFSLALHLGTDPTPIRCGAALARHTPTHLGIQFTDMDEADRVRLGGVIFRYQRLAAG